MNINDLKFKKFRTFDGNELLINLIGTGPLFSWAWGLEKPTRIITNTPNEDIGVRFKVNGYIHKGLVYIFINSKDLFDIYYTDMELNIKKSSKDVNLVELLEVLDHEIERVNSPFNN